jgi:hypothetical protein
LIVDRFVMDPKLMDENLIDRLHRPLTKTIPHYLNKLRSIDQLQHYMIKFVSDLWQVSGFLWVRRFPPPIKLTATIKLFNINFINFDYPFGIYKLFFYKKQTGNNYLLINIFVNFLKFLSVYTNIICIKL